MPAEVSARAQSRFSAYARRTTPALSPARHRTFLILTETKASAGCRLLAEAFTAGGCLVSYPEPGPGEYGTMIISRVAATPDGFGDQVGYLPSRAAAVLLPASSGPLRVIGLYVRSRNASAQKTERKRKWLAACDAALSSTTASPPVIVAGDLNILEPSHQPRYPFFAPFEYDFYQALTGVHGLTDAFRHLHPDKADYSWVGRTGDGYRYDHAFCSRSIQYQRSSNRPPQRAPRPQRMAHNNSCELAGCFASEPAPLEGLRTGEHGGSECARSSSSTGSKTPKHCCSH